MSRAATLCDAYAARRLGVGSVGLCAECADVRCEEQGRKEGDTRDHRKRGSRVQENGIRNRESTPNIIHDNAYEYTFRLVTGIY